MNSISITRWKGLKKYVERARDFAMDFYESPNSAKCYNNILTQMEIIERISEREECEVGGGRGRMTEEQLNDLRNFYGSKSFNAYEQCWVSLKDVIHNNRCSSLGSVSDYADGRRTAYDEMFIFMNTLEKVLGVEKDE